MYESKNACKINMFESNIACKNNMFESINACKNNMFEKIRFVKQIFQTNSRPVDGVSRAVNNLVKVSNIISRQKVGGPGGGGHLKTKNTNLAHLPPILDAKLISFSCRYVRSLSPGP